MSLNSPESDHPTAPSSAEPSRLREALKCFQRANYCLDWPSFWSTMALGFKIFLIGHPDCEIWCVLDTKRRAPVPEELPEHAYRLFLAHPWAPKTKVRISEVDPPLDLRVPRSLRISDWTPLRQDQFGKGPSRKIGPEPRRRVALRDHRGTLRAVLIAPETSPPSAQQSDTHETLHTFREFALDTLVCRAGELIEDFHFFVELDKLRQEIGKNEQFVERDRSRQKLGRPGSFRNLLRLVMERAIDLFDADRGDVGYYNWSNRDGDEFLIQCDQINTNDHIIEASNPGRGPDRGLLRRVWEQGGSYLANDLKRDPDYYGFDERTRSELLIRLDYPMQKVPQKPSRRISVLNLESFTPNWFDARDEQMLQVFAHYVTSEFPGFGKENFYHQVISDLTLRERRLEREEGTARTPLMETPAVFRSIGERYLNRLRDVFGFDSSILYWVDHAKQRLVVFAHQCAKRGLNIPPDFGYSLKEDSFAKDVLRSHQEGLFVADPQWPPEGVRFNSKGIDAFEIDGPVLGLRISDQDGPVGVLVLWSVFNPAPRKEHIKALQPYAQVANILLRAALAQRRNATISEHLKIIFERMRDFLDLPLNLEAVMQGIRALGFDAVRIFKFEYGRSMRGLCCSGMEGYEENFSTFEYSEDTGNPYYKRFIQNYLTRPLAVVYRPDQDGEDPQATKIGKPLDLEWVAAPLVSAGTLYGEIAADNRDTKRRITLDDLESINLFAALAARAFAIDEKRGMLSVQSLTVLYRYTAMAADRDLIIKRLLRFATHGEEGLGFSRALYYRFVPEKGAFVFLHGVGQVNADSFRMICNEVAFLKLAVVLDLADDPTADGPLHVVMREHTIHPERLPERERPAHDGTRSFQMLDTAGKELFNAPKYDNSLLPDGLNCTGEVLATTLWSVDNDRQGKLVCQGLIVADRSFQQLDRITESDQARLGSFGLEAAQVLMLHELRRDRDKNQRLRDIGFLALGYRHELAQPLHYLKMDARYITKRWSAFEGSLADADDRDCLRGVVSLINRCQDRLSVLDGLLSGRDRSERITVAELLEETMSESLGIDRADKPDYRIVFDEETGSIQIAPLQLMAALRNLSDNALNALERADVNPRLVILSAHKVDNRYLEFRVEDNAGGVQPRVLSAVGRKKSPPGRQLGRMGWGLTFVHRVAEIMGGSFMLANPGPETSGLTRATLRIPLSQNGI